MTLTWADIDARWPDAGVAWDRLGAPFDARFEVHDDTLVALHGTCMSDQPISSGEGPGVQMFIWMQGQRESHRHGCRCLGWFNGTWEPQAEFSRRAVETAHKWHHEFVAKWKAMYPDGLRTIVVRAGASNADHDPVWDFGAPPRRHLRGTRAQRKRKRAAMRLASQVRV